MKKIILITILSVLGISSIANAQLRIFTPSQGGTGLGSATAGDVGNCIKVLDDSPFTYELGTCGTGGGGGTDGNWTFFNGSGLRLATTSNQVIIGATATSTLSNPLAKLHVTGDTLFAGNSTTTGILASYTKVTAPYFTATSTSLASVFPYASTTAFTTTNAYITNLANLATGFVKVTAGALSVDTTTYESGLTAGDGLTRTVNDFDCDVASGSVSGCLSSTDWTTFNSKQDAGSYLTAVTADSPLSGAGTAASHLVISTAGTWSGNAGTASALAANPTNCSAGNYPLGIDASGNVENCTTASAGGGTGNVGTSSVPVQGNLAYWTTTTATPALLSTVATGTVSSGTGISVTAGQSIIGSGLTISNTGVTSVGLSSSGSITVGSTPVTTTGTITANLNMGNANTWTALQTFANATTTLLSANYASSTLWYGGGMQTCDATTGKLTWTNGVFGCGTDYDTGGTSAFSWTPTSWGVSTSTTLGFLNGFLSTASSTITDVANLHIPGGSSGQFLSTDGAGTLSWGTAAGGSGGGNSKWATSTDTTSIYTNGATKAGIGTSSPWAVLSIAGSSDSSDDLVSISTSTATATSTVFSIAANGSTTIPNLTTGPLTGDDDAGVVQFYNVDTRLSANGTLQGLFHGFNGNASTSIGIAGFSNGTAGQLINPTFFVGTSTTFDSRDIMTVDGSARSATTTVSLEAECFNVKNSSGTWISFYFVGVVQVIENNVCR